MIEKNSNAESVFDALCALENSGNGKPEKHEENCECVDCASKKWDGNEEEILNRANVPDTQKDIYDRSRKSDQELIDQFNEVNEIKEKNAKIEELTETFNKKFGEKSEEDLSENEKKEMEKLLKDIKTEEEAIKKLQEEAGKKFDPKLVQEFIKTLL